MSTGDSGLDSSSPFPVTTSVVTCVAVPVSPVSYRTLALASYGGYGSRWCDSCGRKRGKDGLCVACDPWWTSPLVQYGTVSIVVVGALLTILIGIVRLYFQTPPPPELSQVVQRAAPSALAPSSPTYTPFNPRMTVSVPSVAVVVSPPNVRITDIPVQATPAPVERLENFKDLARLRALTDYADKEEVRRSAARTLASSAVPTVAVPGAGLPVPAANSGAAATDDTSPPAPPDEAARSADAARTL